jgi:hypothetical protein
MSTTSALDIDPEAAWLAARQELEAVAAELTAARDRLADLEASAARLKEQLAGGSTEDTARAYVAVAAAVPDALRQITALNQRHAEAHAHLHAQRRELVHLHEAEDAEREAEVDAILAAAAAALAAWEADLRTTWNERHDAGLKMPGRLDAIPQRRAAMLASKHFGGRFALTSPFDHKAIG